MQHDTGVRAVEAGPTVDGGTKKVGCYRPDAGGSPGTLDEAMDAVESMVTSDDLEQLKTQDSIRFHTGLGMALRNCFGLWGHSPLSAWFNARGIDHPDTMSGIILESLHRRLNGREIDLDGQIAESQAAARKDGEDYEKGVDSDHFSTALLHVEGRGDVSAGGAQIPRVREFVQAIGKQRSSALQTCWEKASVDRALEHAVVDVRITFDRQGRLAAAKVLDTKLREADATCLAQALVGAVLPEHRGKSFTLWVGVYKRDPEAAALFAKCRNPTLCENAADGTRITVHAMSTTEAGKPICLAIPCVCRAKTAHCDNPDSALDGGADGAP